MPRIPLVLAAYRTESGTAIKAFIETVDALAWKQQIAVDNFEFTFGEVEFIEGVDLTTDAQKEAFYWDNIEGEEFSIDQDMIEVPAWM